MVNLHLLNENDLFEKVEFSFFARLSLSSDVIELNEENFEHETQVSTGATTGDWFIKFYAPWYEIDSIFLFPYSHLNTLKNTQATQQTNKQQQK